MPEDASAPCFTPVKSFQGSGITEALVRTFERDHVHKQLLCRAEIALGSRLSKYFDTITGWQLCEEGQHLIASQLLAKSRPPQGVRPVRLKHILFQIEPDRDDLQRDRSLL